MSGSERPRVLIVGLDGATFDLIEPLVAQGRLPALGRLMQEGAWGVLRSTVPPISPTAWTTFATGKSPGKHGVFDFRHLAQDYQMQTRPMQQRGHKTIWRLLSEVGRRVAVIDVPFTYPPEQVDGLMISGYPTPREPSAAFFHPPELRANLGAVGFDLRLGWPEARIDVHPDFFRAWDEVMKDRERLLEHLYVNEAWDFYMVVLGITDTLAHTLWNFLDPAHPGFRDRRAEEYRQALYRGYEQADHVLGHLWSLVDEHTHLIVVSDHGFGSVRPRQWLFQFLAERGWLRFRKPKGAAATLGLLQQTALRLYTQVGWLRKLVRELRPDAKRGLKEVLERGGLLAQRQNVDCESSPAIPSDMGTHIYLNRRDRFLNGFLDDDEARRLAEEMREALLAVRDAVDGCPMVKAVHFREEVFAGEKVAEAPDLVVEYENRYTRSADPLPANAGLEAGHVPEGVFLAWGPGVAPGQIQETDIVHIAPTVLHLLGQPVPVDMDGRVATVALSPEWMAHHPVRFDDQPAVTIDGTGSEDGYTPDQMADVEAQLRALGYIE